MKDYDLGRWGLSFIFSLEGSVFPKALTCALPNALLAVGLWYLLREVVPQETFEFMLSGFTASQAWNIYNWVIGFLVSFRAQRAYSRWWEGGTLLQQARGEWFNAYSSLVAFCTQNPQSLELVQKFQKTLVRLTSMLYASALMSVATVDDLDFEIIDCTGLSEEHLWYLRAQQDKCEIIMQWIQRLIVDNMENGVLPIPPPVLSRVFQELSRGIVNIHNVRKITEFQFPFPAAQMIVTMLIVQWILTPLMAALLMNTPVWAFIVAFCPVFACWGINYLAGEIEQPFGDDSNDMPLHLMQCSLNTSLLSLLDMYAQRPPDFDSKIEATQSKLDFAEAASVKNYHCSREYKFTDMRSVRHVTIQNHEQAKRVRRRFSRQKTDSVAVKVRGLFFSEHNYLHILPKQMHFGGDSSSAMCHVASQVSQVAESEYEGEDSKSPRERRSSKSDYSMSSDFVRPKSQWEQNNSSASATKFSEQLTSETSQQDSLPSEDGRLAPCPRKAAECRQYSPQSEHEYLVPSSSRNPGENVLPKPAQNPLDMPSSSSRASNAESTFEIDLSFDHCSNGDVDIEQSVERHRHLSSPSLETCKRGPLKMEQRPRKDWVQLPVQGQSVDLPSSSDGTDFPVGLSPVDLTINQTASGYRNMASLSPETCEKTCEC